MIATLRYTFIRLAALMPDYANLRTGHSFVEVLRWLDDDRLEVRLQGYGDARNSHNGGFEFKVVLSTAPHR